MASDKEFPDGWWGKLRWERCKLLAWHPLFDHCIDVAATFLALLDRPVLRRRLAALGERDDLLPVHRTRLGWLAFLHDIGKLSLGFQQQRKRGNGHIRPVGALFCPDVSKRTLPALHWPEMLTWVANEEALYDLFLASLSHHGRPAPLESDPRFLRSAGWLAEEGRDPLAELERMTAAARPFFAAAFAADAPPLPDRPAFQHGFAGLVSLADWIASDETFFPYSAATDPPRSERARFLATQALDRIGMMPERARAVLGADPDPFAAQALVFPPNAAQRAVAELPVAPGVTLLEAPTGSGKTEAALAHFLKLFAAGAVDGMVFALPTRAAAVQIHHRIHEAVGKAFGNEAAPPVLLAVPGYLRVDDADGQRLLTGFQVLWPDHGDSAGRGWAAENSKRFLAGAIVVGTIDQVLMSALRLRHAHLRGSALLRHLLVVDEVHASDPYMSLLLHQVLEMIRAARGHALLMSATLGSAARHLLLKEPDKLAPEAAAALPYPAVSPAAPGLLLASGPRKEVTMQAAPLLHDADGIARMARQAACDDGRVLIIRNTVSAVLLTQQALESGGTDPPLFRCETVASPHHARYAREDRKRLDDAIEDAFGKKSSNPVILAATQTVEQSLDIDADLLITDLCPADVLLQRIGRLHRHQRQRPAGFTVPRCIVLVPCQRDLSAYLVGKPRDGWGMTLNWSQAYADLRGIEATWRMVERFPQWDLPAMNRFLVEEATHPDRLAAIAEAGGPLWRKHQEALNGLFFGQKALARASALQRDLPFGKQAAFGESDSLEGHVTTRLGLQDRLAEFETPFPGPFGGTIQTLPVPGWMSGGIPAEAMPEVRETQPLRFRWDKREFVYDRLGLRPGT